MKPILLLILAIYLKVDVQNLYGQNLNLRDLEGEWIANNKDSIYYKSDTISLYQDANYQYGLETCNLVRWTITRGNFKLSNIFSCSEPGIENFSLEEERLQIGNENKNQYLLLYRSNELGERFKIVDYQEKRVSRYPYDIKVLKLKRIK